MGESGIYHVLGNLRVREEAVDGDPALPTRVVDRAVPVAGGPAELHLDGVADSRVAVIGVPKVPETRLKPGMVTAWSGHRTCSPSSEEDVGVFENIRVLDSGALGPSGVVRL